MSRSDAPEKILNAAEELFAAKGYHGVSLRQIADAAGIVVSLVQYHYKTKEDLFGAVLGRRISVINHERLARLDRLEHPESGAAKPSLEDVLRAFVEPTVLFSRDTARGGPQYAQLIGQIINDPQPHARQASREYADPIARQTIRVLATVLPEMDPHTLAWCYLFAVGSMVAAISPTGRIRTLAKVRPDSPDTHYIIERLAKFLRGGFEAVRDDRSLR